MFAFAPDARMCGSAATIKRGGAATIKSLEFEEWWPCASSRLTDSQVECVSKVVDFTDCPHSQAEALLVTTNWKVDRAVDQFLTNSSTPTIFDGVAHETEEVSLLCSAVVPYMYSTSTTPETSHLSTMFKMGADAALLGAKQSASRVEDLQLQLLEIKIKAAIDRTEEEGRRRLHHIEEQYQIMLKEQNDNFKLSQQKAASLDKQKTAENATLKSENATLKSENATLTAAAAAP